MSPRDRLGRLRGQLRLPLIAAPMFLVSGPELVLGACRAGIGGAFPAPNARTIEGFEEWLARTAAGHAELARAGARVGPWCVNLVTHRTYERLGAELELVEKYRPPIVITALGGPAPVVERVHAYGGLVIADVSTVEFARKAAATGVDGLAVICSGAGGHTGRISAFAFVPAVRAFFDGLLVVGGSIGTGGAIRAAELLGADLVYAGTPFIATAESLASDRYRDMVVRARLEDLVLTKALTGAEAYYLRESIVVIDSTDRIRLINESARQILGPTAQPGGLLGEVSPRLLWHVERWRRRPDGAPVEGARLVAADGGREVEAYFAPLGSQRPAPVLVFLEDTTRLAERVQQTKLAALGRLSASIAHEIRNPVGAMSHAAQLLAEGAAPGSQESRLTQIITNHAERVSTIISNVLQLSRREATRPERLYAHEWLKDFLEEFSATLQVPEARIRALAPGPDIEIRVDPSHLHQIVWNLCDNALRHSGDGPDAPPVELRIGRLHASGRPFLEVADRGTGIPDESVDRIFEPFFTSRQGGTGLGLFIARELAQCNGAVLLYEPRNGGGSIFRVTFADPQRWEAP